MQIKCFACDVQVEAGSADAIADAFVAHAREAHKSPYPEDALRNYARNNFEAAERIAGAPIERLEKIGDVAAYHVTGARIDDWLAFFDRDAFAGNPDWASCYCFEPHKTTEGERPWRANRAAMAARLRDGTTVGYLAYVDGRAAGWVNASLRADYSLYARVDPDGPAPASVIGIACFVIAPPYRRHRIASALLDRAIADAAGRGADWVEAYCHNKPEASDAGHFRGPRSMYEARGFKPIEDRQRYTVMRLAAKSAPV